jgi:tetratricopeptide (TPR) repeat protein
MARHHRPRSACVALALVLAVSLPPQATASAQGAGAYASIIERYAGGDRERALVELAQWKDAPVGDAIEKMLLPLSLMRPAVMLHTDVAYVWLASGDASRALAQIEYASRLVTALLRGERYVESTRTFAIRWYAFATSMYASQGRTDLAARFLNAGLIAFPRAAELYVARGSIQEMRATLDENDVARRDIPSTRAGPQLRIAGLLESAARDYQHALDLDGALAMAQLHRGWVHHRLHDSRAGKDLESALAAATDDNTRYLAHLFLGAEDERRNDLPAASREYQAAVLVGPHQTAYVALSRVEEGLGHAAAAQQFAQEYAKRTVTSEDPWWDYRLSGINLNDVAWLRGQVRTR